MTDSLLLAKQKIIQAGKELLSQGLVARTWGNISARLSDTQFAISPSGRSYDTLTPDQIVVVNITNLSFQGSIKPSSEKGIHADIYRLRKDVQFIIHTHQNEATALSISGESYSLEGFSEKEILGLELPCAPYGISSTKTLRKQVAMTVEKNPSAKAILMQSHGAICLGSSNEEAFAISNALENVSKRIIERELDVSHEEALIERYMSSRKTILATQVVNHLGTSHRIEDHFLLDIGQKEEYPVDQTIAQEHWFARLHQNIYRHDRAVCIVFENDPFVVAYSATGKTLRPSIDDLAQIGGASIRTTATLRIAHSIRNRNALFVVGCGALCWGETEEDAQAVAMILKKACKAEVVSSLMKKTHRLRFFDAWIQRTVYVHKYSKMKG